MKRREFICGLSCLVAGAAATELGHKLTEKKCNNPKNDEYNPIHRELSEIYVEMTTHCNLDCKGCDAFSPISKEEFVTYEEFTRDFTKLKELYPNKDLEILYLGGEPLLNPDLIPIVKKAKELFPNGKQSLMSNGILLDKMDEEFWQTMKDANVKLRVSNHPIDIDRSKGELTAKKYGVELVNDIIYTDKLYDMHTHEVTKDNLVPKKGHYWSKLILDLAGTQDYVEKRYTCVLRHFGNSYIRGNLYLCWIHAHINCFAEYFHVNIPITKDDYIKIADVKDAKEIDDFISTPKPLCRFCKQSHNTSFGGKPVDWGFTNKDISEWT